jgi:SHS2 domain-containing protein
MGDSCRHFSEFSFLEHEADIGIRGVGDCWECAFSAGAVALLEVMADPSSVKPLEDRTVDVTGDDIGLLFVSWLNELLYLRDVEGMLFSRFQISVKEIPGDGWRLTGTARGETLSAERHSLKTEVKAATYSGLKWGVEGNRRYVQCLLDL